MNFERAIRRYQIKDYTSGHKIILPQEVYEQGVLSTQQRHGQINVSFKKNQSFPKSLVLRASISGIPLQVDQAQAGKVQTDDTDKQSLNPPSTIQYVINGQAQPALPFYGLSSLKDGYENLAKASWHKAVEVRYCQYGFCDNQSFQGNKVNDLTLVLKNNSLIYRQDFHRQTKPNLIQRCVVLSENHWVISDLHGCTKTNGTPLLSYGGVYRPDLTIDKIVPSFAILTSHQDQTHLLLYSLIGLKERNVVPPKGGICGASYWYFADNLPKSSLMSLASCLQEGLAEVILEDQNTQETCCYCSQSYAYVGDGTTMIDITFVPKLKTVDQTTL